MPELDYKMLDKMPAVSETAESIDTEMAPDSQERADGLDPHLAALGKEMGLSGQQAAALKEFVAACLMSQDEDEYASDTEL